jgi:hypothetical protein
MCIVDGSAVLPPGVMSIADTITIVEDLGNRIPDKSWMLYLLEAFDRKKGAPVELNLICQFNDRNNFWAIFGGKNRYKFTKVLPHVGHTYLRQIIFQSDMQAIDYVLTDRTDGQREEYRLGASGDTVGFQTKNHFTGIEWWNRVGGDPFPVRYRVEIAELMCGMGDGREGITYMPYDGLVPDSDRATASYPVSFFAKPAIASDAGDGYHYISYDVGDGTTNAGLRLAGGRGRPATL